jgi:hypothetical protein
MHQADVDERIIEIGPDVLAIERMPHVFACAQLQFDGTTDLDSHWSTVYALASGCDIAFVDRDWRDLEKQYLGPERQSMIDEAYKHVGVDPEKPIDERCFDEHKQLNQALNELYPTFYTEFVVKRNIAIARHLAELVTQETYESVVCLVGYQHLRDAAEITRDILAGRDGGLTPTAPRTCCREELTDIIEPINELAEHLDDYPDIPSDADKLKQQFAMQRKRYRRNIQSLIQELTA